MQSSSRPPMVFYYGKGNMAALTRYSRAVLQPSHYTSLELGWLRRHGVETLAYLDAGGTSKGKVWQQETQLWGKQFVRQGTVWTQPVLEQVKTVFELGFSGLFLDGLESDNMTFRKRLERLELVAEVRALAGKRTLLANRGFGLMPELLEIVDGVVFEAFSTRWSGKTGYSLLSKRELAWSATVALELQRKQLPIYALDYADNAELKHFARRRAEHFGFTSLIANRELTQL